MQYDTMLQNEVVNACRQSLSLGAVRRRAVNNPEQWRAWREQTLSLVRNPFPETIFSRPKVEARLVSSHEFEHFRLENVLFESLPGWQVNASVYLPKSPGVYPAVICPTGHSAKTEPSYQKPAQVFARNGYIAISFDPPGCAGEIAHMNDHFTNGLIGYLTGFWSESHFVVDALACIDYALSRSDVDRAAGISVTGVSGGGLTSIFAAMLDDRVAFAAPVCCLAEHESIHLNGLYTSCPEQFGPGYIAGGLDYVDYISLIAPRPCLMICGKGDEVFDYRSSERIFEEVRRIYTVSGNKDGCGFFVDENSGHAYTVAMANETVRWMNRVIRKTDASPLQLRDEDVQLLPKDKLLCRPDAKSNMFTINRDEAMRLAKSREDHPKDGNALRSAIERTLGIPRDSEPLSISRAAPPLTSWNALVEELLIRSSQDTQVPGLMFSHVSDKIRHPAILWIDDRGRWTAFRYGAALSRPLRIYDTNCLPDQPRILSIDVSGLGALTPRPTAYDLAPWNDIERILTYMSVANGRPVMGLRVRDALCALRYLRSRTDVDPERVVIAGRGIGGIVALHVAVMAEGIAKVVCVESLSHYGSFTEVFPFSWRQSAIIPGILKEYDLPEVAASFESGKVCVINPFDAAGKPVDREAAGRIYADAAKRGAVIECGIDADDAMLRAVGGK